MYSLVVRRLSLFAMVLAVAVPLVSQPLAGGEIWWDLMNVAGFIGFGGLLALSLASGRSMDVRKHQVFSLIILAVITLHVLSMTLFESGVRSYLTLSAPHYMMAGIAGFGLLWLQNILALPADRNRVHASHRHFRLWHRILGGAVLGLCVWHIIGSGFYVNSRLEAGMLVLFVIVSAAVPTMTSSRLPSRWGLLAVIAVAACFVGIKQL